MKTLSTTLVILPFALSNTLCAKDKPLPSPDEFDAGKYMGKWYEVARLPTPVQPEGTLATAEYSAGDEDGKVVVKNTAYDAEGNVLRAMEGKAQLAGGDAKGRLKVSFGPALPDSPNYCVLRVDKRYRTAVVGSPDRGSLWILSRKVPLPEKRLNRLAKVAEKAGYDTSKLVIANWPEKFAATGGAKPAQAKSPLSGDWTLHLEGPGGRAVELPMELKVKGDRLTGRIGRGDGRWMELKDGKMDGKDAFTFSVERDREGGGTMTYAMAGKYADGKLTGTAKTEIEGRGEITSEWKAAAQSEQQQDN